MSAELALKLWNLPRVRVVVCGDALIDVDVHGECGRFAAESPGCPVFRETSREERPGGAGAVAAMCAALGAEVELFSGPDGVKTRHFAGGRLLWRHDREAAPPEGVPDELEDRLDWAEAVLIADHGKGVCSPEVLRAAIGGARAEGVPCLVDPAPGRDWRDYQGCAAIKCNAGEWFAADHGARLSVGDRLVITTGAAGLTHAGRGAMPDAYPARQRDALDVTGAGDMVLAALGVCLAGGMAWDEACQIAVAASGLKVERRGAVGVSRAEVCLDLLFPSKMLPAELLPAVREAAKAAGKSVVWTNGVFDLLGSHHLAVLREAKAQGDILIVGVDDDEAARAAKGPGRPAVPLGERAALLAALGFVGWVVSYGRGGLPPCLEALRPGCLVKGADYAPDEVVGASLAGRVHLAPLVEGRSTTATLARLRHAAT